MSVQRTLLLACVLSAACAAAPAVAADDAVDKTLLGHEVTLCVIGVKGGCDPYDGDLARASIDGKETAVPDPCYTTACF